MKYQITELTIRKSSFYFQFITNLPNLSPICVNLKAELKKTALVLNNHVF